MANSDAVGSISIWRNESDNEKAPLFRGTIQDGDRKVIFEIALWKNDSDNEKAPVLVGKLNKPFVKDDNSKAKTKPKSNEIDF